MSSFSRLYLKLTAGGAEVPGEATDADYLGQIVLSSMKWNIARAKETEGRDRGRPEPGELDFSKLMDKSSTPMMEHMKVAKELVAVLTLDSHTDSKIKLLITLTGARLTGFKIDASDSEKSGEIKEDWSLTYSKLTLQYTSELGTTKTSNHERTVDMAGRDDVQALLDKFKALKSEQLIQVKGDLQSAYNKAEKIPVNAEKPKVKGE
ncbi:type VI secretion system tube protein Hcp [Paucibacter sp. R3-3]|uniref:Type VI secretion system tube protein Hcp n=1 Tax=Roseateles agri TaxID=3098619 RepID=A0ABU5DI62_9BURK|nr:type VI secretion system tube protein Hcp [Paucibacter sp. R3-3]MDY0745967.1 type VI secretion system tube protein Hcp [Paucibacter sp. R3-3]